MSSLMSSSFLLRADKGNTEFLTLPNLPAVSSLLYASSTIESQQQLSHSCLTALIWPLTHAAAARPADGTAWVGM